MKSYENTVTAEVSGASETKKLSIEANSKAFKELISGIYADKAYAITRETSANGYDSHVQAGIPTRPIVIHVPWALEPHYSVRDYGVSMTHDIVMELYSTLFRSTKDDPNSDDSNRYVGKFGLGSKSPFAYTDSFQLECYLDGNVRIYDIYFNQGTPSISLLHEGSTEEEQGVLVSFGVQPKDFADFERAIKRTIEGFDVVPLFTGKEITPYSRTVRSESEGWRLLNGTQTNRAEARQGTVLYPLNSQAIINLPDELKALCEQPFRFDFAIGQLDVVTSREALSYDEQTSNNIIARLNEVMDEIRSRVAARLVNATTYWEFSKAYFDALDEFPEKVYGNITAVKPTFKGREPVRAITVSTQNVRTKLKYWDPVANLEGEKVTFHARFGSMTYAKFSGSDLRNKTVMFRQDRNAAKDQISLNVAIPVVVLLEDLNDKNRYPAARVKTLVDGMDYQTKGNTQLLWIRHFGDKQYVLNRLFVAFGRPTTMRIVNLMDIPYDAPPRQYFSGPRAQFRILRNGDWVRPDPTTPLPDSALYLPMRNGEIDTSETLISNSITAWRIHETLIELGDADIPVIGIPRSSRKIIKDQAGWEPFDQYAVEMMKTFFDEGIFANFTYHSEYKDNLEFFETLEGIKTQAGAKAYLDATTGSSIEVYTDFVSRLSQKHPQGNLQKVIWGLLADNEKKVNDQAHSAWSTERHAIIARIDAGEVDLVVPDAPERTNVYGDIHGAAIKAGHEADDQLSALEKSVHNDFPLLDAVDNYRLSRDARLAKELVNYVFNKRLLATEEPVEAVDVAIAA